MRTVWLVLLFLSLSNSCRNEHTQKFLYFAYGSNLLESRIRINVPSAAIIGSARLPGYRLDFDKYCSKWRGAPSTIAADPEGEVWGALWAVDYSEKEALDKQEGVNNGFYEPIHVKVINLENQTITARTYKMTRDPAKVLPEDLPVERRPSITYLQVMALGAFQCGIPSYYIEYIYRFPSNHRFAVDKLCQELGYPFNTNVQIT